MNKLISRRTLNYGARVVIAKRECRARKGMCHKKASHLHKDLCRVWKSHLRTIKINWSFSKESRCATSFHQLSRCTSRDPIPRLNGRLLTEWLTESFRRYYERTDYFDDSLLPTRFRVYRVLARISRVISTNSCNMIGWDKSCSFAVTGKMTWTWHNKREITFLYIILDNAV